MSPLLNNIDAAVSEEDRYRTPSPQDDSHDEYTPTRQSIRSPTVWVTPSQRSSTSSIATNTRAALDALYKTLYGQDPVRCLLPQAEARLNVPHPFLPATKSPEMIL